MIPKAPKGKAPPGAKSATASTLTRKGPASSKGGGSANTDQDKDATAQSPSPAAAATTATTSSHKRSIMEQEFDKFRGMDRLDEGVDAIGPNGLQALCIELGIPFNDQEMFVLAWKFGATQSYCITRSEWMHAVYVYKIDHLGTVKTQLSSWKANVRNDETAFTEMYFSIYDFVRGDDEKLLPLEKAIKVWQVLLPEPERFLFLTLWAQWCTLEFKKPITRDVWRQLWEFARSVKDLSAYDPNAKWPTALDDFVEWAKEKQRQKEQNQKGAIAGGGK